MKQEDHGYTYALQTPSRLIDHPKFRKTGPKHLPASVLQGCYLNLRCLTGGEAEIAGTARAVPNRVLRRILESSGYVKSLTCVALGAFQPCRTRFRMTFLPDKFHGAFLAQTIGR